VAFFFLVGEASSSSSSLPPSTSTRLAEALTRVSVYQQSTYRPYACSE
jgi:hypothetical protein